MSITVSILCKSWALWVWPLSLGMVLLTVTHTGPRNFMPASCQSAAMLPTVSYTPPCWTTSCAVSRCFERCRGRHVSVSMLFCLKFFEACVAAFLVTVTTKYLIEIRWGLFHSRFGHLPSAEGWGHSGGATRKRGTDWNRGSVSCLLPARPHFRKAPQNGAWVQNVSLWEHFQSHAATGYPWLLS